MLYDVSTLHFEIDEGDDFRVPGFSKERRLDPQITIGMLTDAGGFPFMVDAFEGNRAETKTMLPVIRSFLARTRPVRHDRDHSAGMVSEENQRAHEEAGLSFILGARIPFVRYVVATWRGPIPEKRSQTA